MQIFSLLTSVGPTHYIPEHSNLRWAGNLLSEMTLCILGTLMKRSSKPLWSFGLEFWMVRWAVLFCCLSVFHPSSAFQLPRIWPESEHSQKYFQVCFSLGCYMMCGAIHSGSKLLVPAFFSEIGRTGQFANEVGASQPASNFRRRLRREIHLGNKIDFIQK